MIISASRRTDIPAFYSTWFFNRLREGYVLVPNPFDTRQVSRIRLDPAVADCIVFWTKNPAPMLPRLGELDAWNYYFHFTLNPYGPDAEPGLKPLPERIETFRRLAERIGPKRVIWRYDPVLVNERYTLAFHEEAFARIAEALQGHTRQCILGYLDRYAHIRRALDALHVAPLRIEEIELSARAFRQSAGRHSIRLTSCTSKPDLSHLAIPSGSCIDGELIRRITGCPLAARKDGNQRPHCNCIESIDIGTYDTCLHGCIYCYAVRRNALPAATRLRHDPASPLLLGTPADLHTDAVVRDRPMHSLLERQLPLL